MSNLDWTSRVKAFVSWRIMQVSTIVIKISFAPQIGRAVGIFYNAPYNGNNL